MRGVDLAVKGEWVPFLPVLARVSYLTFLCLRLLFYKVRIIKVATS